MNENLVAALIILLYFSPLIYQLVIVLREFKNDNKLPLKRFISFLKYSLVIFVFISSAFAIISHTNYFDYEKPITYDKLDEITFENFRGVEFLKKSLYGNKHFAYVVVSIESKIVSDQDIVIKTLFHPSRSYVYSKHTDSKDLLRHEKYHIKITELFVRKAKQKISKLLVFDKSKIEEIIEEAKSEENKYQRKYDFDTFHSYVYSEQMRYEKVIDSSLNLLSKYTKNKIRINEKN